jgi:hypothetical protein
MKSSTCYQKIFVPLFIFVFITTLKSQYIIEQIVEEIPVNYELIPEDTEFEAPDGEINFILDIPANKLKAGAIANGAEINEEKSIIYIDGNNFCIETVSEENGKVSMIANSKTNNIYTVLWPQKKVVELKPEDIENMKKKAKEATEKMLKYLSPEMRENLMNNMNQEKDKTKVEYQVKPTGEKKQISGLNCSQFRVSKGEEIMDLWVTEDSFGLFNDVIRISKKFEELYNTDNDNEFDEWQILPGQIPVQLSTFTESISGEPVIVIRKITKIENKKSPVEKFYIPGDKEGFTKGSFMDMMSNK